MNLGPQRIVCLTEEPTEILYRIGQGHRVVGISAYTVRPPEAKEKPVVSAFIGGSVPKIAALKPDLVIGFSDIQADLAKELIKANLPVLIFNQRSIKEIFEVIQTLGLMVDAKSEALALEASLRQNIARVEARARGLTHRPRVYFEEWNDPMISAIEWVSELVEIAGGESIFKDRASGKLAKERFVTPDEVIAKDPELVLASWCGEPFDRTAFLARPGFSGLSAARNGHIYEVPSELILQPGPACLSDGLNLVADLIYEARIAG